MATNPSTLSENVGRVTAPDANYPYGSTKDDTTGTAGDGTPLKKAFLNDIYGFFQASMVAAGIVPSGNAETVIASQILQALQGVVGSFSDKSQWPTIASGADIDHDIDFSAGKITDSTGRIPIVSTGLTKQIDAAWSVGNNAGGLFSGTVAASTTYHLFFIVNDTTGAVDAGFDVSPVAANIPAGYTAFRRIASLYTDASSNLVQFYQQGDYFGLKISSVDMRAAPVIGVGTLQVMSAPLGLTNLKIYILASVQSATLATATSDVLITSIFQDDIASTHNNRTLVSSPGNESLVIGGMSLTIPLGATCQVRYWAQSSNTVILQMDTYGWTDDRTQ